MKVIQQLNRYNQFCQSQVFQRILDQLSNHQAHILTYQYLTKLSLISINEQKTLLLDQRPNWKSFQKQYEVFLSTFQHFANSLQQQHTMASHHFADLAFSIKSLENNRHAWVDIQNKLVQHSCNQLNRLNAKVKRLQSEIEMSKIDIEGCKQQCFVKMINFARELSEVNIKLKFSNENAIEIIQEYGSKSSEMNSYLYQTIPELQNSISQKNGKIKDLKLKISKTVNEAISAFYQAETAKINILNKINHIFSKKPVQELQQSLTPLQYQPQQYNVNVKTQFSSLKHMKKTVDLTLHPHNRSQTIIAHRQSLSSLCSELQQSGMRSDRLVVVEVPQISHQLSEPDILKQFCVIINDHFNKYELLTPSEVSNFNEYVKDSFRSDKSREVFLFFLYNKIKQKGCSLNTKQEELYLSVINLCVQKSVACYDSQTIIKLILLALQIQSQEQGVQFYKRIDSHAFIDNFQFWQTTFIENIYQYTEVMVNFYHLQLEQLKKEHANVQSNSFWDIFKPIKNLFRLHPIQQTNPTSMKDLFPEIFKNVFTIYLSLMRVLGVQQPLRLKLKQRITLSVERLDFNQQEKQYLNEKLTKLDNRDEGSLKTLLRNDIILERALSKVIGPSGRGQEKPQCESSLSRSIRQWENTS